MLVILFKKIVHFLILLTIGMSCGYGNTQKAYDLLINGQLSEAIIEFEAAINNDPTNSNLQFNIGIAFYKTHRYSSAQNAFEKALRYKIEDTEFQAHAEYNIGNTLFQQAKLFSADNPDRTILYIKEAITAFNNASKLKSGFEEAVYNQSVCQHLLKSLVEEKEEQTEQQESKASDQEDFEQQETSEDSAPSDASKKPSNMAEDAPNQTPNPKEDAKLGSGSMAKQMSLQEAIMLLNSAELDEKQIALSSLLQEKGSTETTRNW